MLTTARELASKIGEDPRLARWSVRSADDDLIEIETEGTTLIVAWPPVWRDPERLVAYRRRAERGELGLLLACQDSDLTDELVEALGRCGEATLLSLPTRPRRVALVLGRWVEMVQLRREAVTRAAAHERARHENELLLTIGRALSQQRDIRALLKLILSQARKATGADAGSVWIVEGGVEDDSERSVRFVAAENDSVRIPSSGFTLPVKPTSIVGACVIHKRPIAILDLYGLDPPRTGNNPWGFVHDRSFDEKHDYQTRSMVTLPLISARTQVIGVIQLIHQRQGEPGPLASTEDFTERVIPFDREDIDLAMSLASQAGIALENALLYDEVRKLFEGFVRASVGAIESRDPTTSGHSLPVADLTLGLARAVSECTEGPFAEMSFSERELKEIEYAALLHDFGKVGVREHVLVKPKKLLEGQHQVVLSRFDYIRRTVEAEAERAKVDALLGVSSRAEGLAEVARLDTATRVRLRQVDDWLECILQANEPRLLEDGAAPMLAQIAAETYTGPDGRAYPFLSEDELHALQVPRGSLTEEERAEIESHVVHSRKFLRRIPWGRTYRNVPDIAARHHEKLDGTGYPDGAAADEITQASRAKAIPDIYDALTASDRPYKKAVPHDRAMKIVASEVERGHLDPELFKLFEAKRVYDLVRERTYTGPLFKTQVPPPVL